MIAERRVRLSLSAAALVLGMSTAASAARDGVHTIPLAAVSPSDNRNIADIKPQAEVARSRSQSERGDVSVTVDRAKIIRLPERTQTVIIGNPAVADVSIQRNGIVVLTGKSFGVTNFIALDGSGAMIGESMVSVSAPNDSTVTLQLGAKERQTYSCTPACHPSVALGDSNAYFGETKGQVDQHSSFVTQR